MSGKTFTIVGGGPVGTLLSISLARHGYRVGLFEGRPDSRLTSIYQGRSINIALSDRGWSSLSKVGVGESARERAIPMYHRAVHALDGEVTSLPYGGEGDAIWSVSRGGINEMLLDIAEAEPNVTLEFEHRLVDIDFETAETKYWVRSGRERTISADYAFGADGARSKVRRLAHSQPRFSYSQTYMPQCYIELHIAANADGSHQLQTNALHIWPRKDFMLIALPNPDGTFTCTLFLNHSGDPSFESLETVPQVEAFFEANFADAMPLLEDPVERFLDTRASPLFLVQVYPWTFNRRIGLIGDAAHAIVPFYGQGMNCGFEDCAELHRLIDAHNHDWNAIFPAYETSRKANADAIAELSKRNFVEMSDLSGDPAFRLRKKIEARFSQHYPQLWTPLYSMVTFSPDIPYAEALRVGDRQEKIMQQIMAIPDIEKIWREDGVMQRMVELTAA